MAVGGLVLEIAEPMTVPGRLRRVLMLEGFFQSMSMVCVTVGRLGAVGHDDVGMTVRRFTGRSVRMLDDLHQPVDMRIRAKIMAVNVLVIVLVRHRPMLRRSGQAATGQ